MTDAAAFYVGHVMHRRLRPVRHALKHSCYWMLLDIDRIGEIAGSVKLFSHNRFKTLSFRDRDHGDGSSRPLRLQVEDQLRDRGITPPGGAIRLLNMPRVLGYSFNPLSVFFCDDRAGDCTAKNSARALMSAFCNDCTIGAMMALLRLPLR